MSDDLNRQIFKEEAYELLGELEGTLLELEQSPEDADLINQAFRALHTIKGSGAMFGFEAVAEFTHEVESVFDMVRNGRLPVTKALTDLVFQARDHIQVLLGEDEGGAPADPEAAEAILEGLRRVAEGGGESESPSEPESAPESEPEPEIFVPAEPEEAAEVCWRLLVRPLSPQVPENFDPQFLFSELARLGRFTVNADVSALPGLADLDPRALHLAWEAFLITRAGESAIRDVFFFSDAALDVEIAPADPEAFRAAAEQAEAAARAAEQTLRAEAEAAPGPAPETPPDKGRTAAAGPAVAPERPERPQAPAAAKAPEAAPPPPPPAAPPAPAARPSAPPPPAAPSEPRAPAEPRHDPRSDAASSLRVSADKLDSLVDLVGELVIVQAQLTQLVSERHDPQLTMLAEELERLSDELRDSTLSIRMLPISTTFSKFRRLVRDLSAELGKQIELSTLGGETELDKTVLERLGDPLVHLLRNSIDHGIEPPADRTAAGKPGTGTIQLAAEHSGGEVLIRITDDGKGMDPALIREKAVERGLLARDAEISDKDVLKVIFEPGFSTAKKVTNVSGRGVGMDVVKRAIDALRGSIDIDSAPGRGTVITVRLPLTLAIIDGLQVQVGDGYFVIPLSLVEECVELTMQHKEDHRGQSILYLRGEIVPYVELRPWFGIEGERPDIEQVVVTGVEGSRVGIVVDHVVGEHQTVIKSLGKVYKDVEGISGATIKGDGSIALILDVPRLVRQVVRAQG
ncbi:MAG: chemotaxis protein CheA [Desulfovibrionaceae bacterium]